MAKTVKGGNFERALAEITKEYGERALVPASQISSPRRISTGLFALDALLAGGIPLGRVTELVGEPSSGKSTLSLVVVANAQRTDRVTYLPLQSGGQPMRAVWLDLEGTFDPAWARAAGADVESLYVAPASYLEQAYDMVMALIRTGEVDLIVIDSVAAMAPFDETDSSMEDQQIGLAARGMNKGLRKLTAEFNRIVQTHEHAPAVIMINQMRERIGVMFGSPETSPGGRGREFFASLRIKLWPEALSKALKNDAEEIVARTSSCKIEKNKVNGVYGQTRFQIYVKDHGRFGKGTIDDSQELLETAVRFGVLQQSGAFYTMPDESKQQGREKALTYLLERPEMFAMVRAEVIDRAGGTRRA